MKRHYLIGSDYHPASSSRFSVSFFPSLNDHKGWRRSRNNAPLEVNTGFHLHFDSVSF